MGEIQAAGGWDAASAKVFNENGKTLEAETDPAKRKALFVTMLDRWEEEVPRPSICIRYHCFNEMHDASEEDSPPFALSCEAPEVHHSLEIALDAVAV